MAKYQVAMIHAQVVMSHIYLPIPNRNFDWIVCFDEHEEAREYGFGRSEQEAMCDLLENYFDA